MSSWLIFVIGVIIGLLIGWLIDLFYHRRPDTSLAPEAVEPVITSPEDAAPLAEASYEGHPPASSPPAPEPVAKVKPEQELPSTPEESRPAEPPAITERAAEVEEEAESPASHATRLAAEAPLAAEGVPPAAVAAVAANEVAERASGELAADADARDKLIAIEGIGPVYEAKLHDAGIHTFRQLAEAGDERLREIIEPKSWQRVDFGEWKEQALLLAEGRDEELKALQARLFSRKKA